MLCHLREDIGDADAIDIGTAGLERPAYLRRGVGLGIPGINLARAADEEEHDAVDVVIGRSRGGLQTVELWQREAKQAQRPGMEEVPPGEAIAEGSSSRGIKTEHMEGLCGPYLRVVVPGTKELANTIAKVKITGIKEDFLLGELN